jgi:hypothetical protein
VADAAGFHFNADMTAPGLWNGAVNDFEITFGLADLNGFHGNPFLFGWMMAYRQDL